MLEFGIVLGIASIPFLAGGWLYLKEQAEIRRVRAEYAAELRVRDGKAPHEHCECAQCIAWRRKTFNPA